MIASDGRDDLKWHADPSPLPCIAGSTTGDDVPRAVLPVMHQRHDVICLETVGWSFSAVRTTEAVHPLDGVPLAFTAPISFSRFEALPAALAVRFPEGSVGIPPLFPVLVLPLDPLRALTPSGVRQLMRLPRGLGILSLPLAGGFSVLRHVALLASRVQAVSTPLVAIVVSFWLRFAAGYARFHGGDCTTISIRGA